MLNAEKHKDEIVQHNYRFAVDEAGKVRTCESGSCYAINCIFRTTRECPRARAEWMLSDAVPQTREQVLAVLDKVNGCFAINKNTQEVTDCEDLECGDCKLVAEITDCPSARYGWLRENGFIK